MLLIALKLSHAADFVDGIGRVLRMLLIALKHGGTFLRRYHFQRVLRMLLIALKRVGVRRQQPPPRVLRMLLIALKLFGMNNFKHNCARIAHAINSIETNQNTVACSEKMARIAHAINSVETHPCSGRQSLVRAYCACY